MVKSNKYSNNFVHRSIRYSFEYNSVVVGIIASRTCSMSVTYDFESHTEVFHRHGYVMLQHLEGNKEKTRQEDKI